MKIRSITSHLAMPRLAAGVMLVLLGAYASPVCAQPSAAVKVWHIRDTVGFLPDEAIEDVGGLTNQVATAADPLTIVTSIECATNPGGPCGVFYWNPATNVFRDFGFGFGFQSGIDLTRTAPPKSDGVNTYGPGDIWMAKSGTPRFLVHLAGTGNGPLPTCGTFITFGTSATFGCEVDQATGNVWLTELSAGNVALLDPATAVLTRWNVGGRPHYVTQDGSGAVYATVDNGPGGDQIVKIDPATNTVTRWLIPGSFVSGFETPNGIVIDTAGNVWFVETGSNSIGRLNPGTNEICQFTKVGISRPQLIATSGSGGLRQVFFTESTGNSVSVLSEAEAVGVCAIVTPTTSTVTPTTPTVSRGTLCKPAREFVITPSMFIVPGVDGGAPPSGKVKCSDGTPIPGILRFSPMPTAPPGSGANNPSGMTRVAPAQTIHGTYFRTHQVFRLESCAIIAPPEPPDDGIKGRMTGGGSVFQAGTGTRFTHGFELHCDPSAGPNRLQINWGKGNKFHLTSLDSATCSDDPALDEGNPVAGFDTFEGSGIGRLNGVPGAKITFKFTDDGEPGKGVDLAEFTIDDGVTTIVVSGFLDKGNQQAHPENE